MHPRVRLTHSDVSVANLQAPGVTWSLLRKVSTERLQVRRGKACTRCRIKKLKCDYGVPCQSCAKAKVLCDAGGSHVGDLQPSVEAYNEPALMHNITLERPISATFWGPRISTRSSASDVAELCGPQSNPFYDSIFTMYGIQKEVLLRMLSHLPPKLRLALSHLGARMGVEVESASHLDAMPENADAWEGSTLCRQIIKRDNGSKRCAHNSAIAALAGAHPEEIATRMNAVEVPPFTSEYRMICLHLYLLLARIRGVKQLTHFQPTITRFFNQTADTPPTVQILRATRNFYSDGEINVACVVQPEEYDAAVRVCPEARMEFVECDLAGRELSGTVITEQEQIQQMAATAEGRAKLNRLADSVIKKFQLDIPSSTMDDIGGSLGRE